MCKRRDKAHLALEAHPFDPDYSCVCRAAGTEAVKPSLKGIFDWVDVDNSGKISRRELEDTLPLLSNLFGEKVSFTKEAWQRLDEDGNGQVNFSEFAEWAGPRLGLPLGVQHLFSEDAFKRVTACGIVGCPCQSFRPSARACHPSIGAAAGRLQSCRCGHKLCAHVLSDPSESEVPYPSYWSEHMGEFSSLVVLGRSELELFQDFFNETYSNIWTRDRRMHSPVDDAVPAGFRVMKGFRSQSSKYWREYCVRRAELLRDRSENVGSKDGFVEYSDVKSALAWTKLVVKHVGVAADRLQRVCNEWYLFHGTSPEDAERICSGDFKIDLAGRNTGTLYGRGVYFADSITKADEYAKPNEAGEYAVLICRVLGGRVRYVDDSEPPDPEDLVRSCIEGPYDCILGDREKCRGTYREYVIYDTENVYPEYVVYYRREM